VSADPDRLLMVTFTSEFKFIKADMNEGCPGLIGNP
jgi:hypothetical protein